MIFLSFVSSVLSEILFLTALPVPVLMVSVVNAAGSHHLPVVGRFLDVLFAPRGKLRAVVVTGWIPGRAVFAIGV